MAALPVPANTTCDIYRVGNAPPANPDVAGVKVNLSPKGQSTLTTSSYTHVMLVPQGTDIRDNFIASSFSAGANCDNVYVPDKNGTKFAVVLVRRIGRGSPLDHLQVLLARQAPTWPSQDL